MTKLPMITKDPAINAYKYRNPGSTINIFSNIREGYFSLSVMNETVTDPYGGIPRKYEKLVLEPFFRLLPVN